MKKFLIALPAVRGQKGFCHQTILVKAKDKKDAIAQVPKGKNIGDIKEVDY